MMLRSGRGIPWLVIAIIFIGAALRIAPLLADARFHPDEAYFSGFARRAAVQGEWLLPGDLDKPPLALYASAVAMSLLAVTPGPDGVLDMDLRLGEIAARLPSAAAGIITIALAYRAARRFGPRQGTGVWAALLVAGSPLGVAFSATAFTDTLMMMFVCAALVCAREGRGVSLALCLALAIGCKFQAVYAAPLILWFGAYPVSVSSRRRSVALATMVGVAAGLLAVALWDGLRQQAVPLLTLAAQHNDPARLIRPDEILPRLSVWLEQGRALFGAPTVIVMAAGLVVGFAAWFRRLSHDAWLCLGLTVWLIAYAALHWLVAFNTYDRYLLLTLPAMALLGARGLTALHGWLSRRLPSAEAATAVGIIGVAVLASGLSAARGQPPAILPGSSFERADGIDALAAFIDAQPPGTIVYDVWLGWELSYYLDPWSDKRRVYYPTPHDLLVDAVAQPDRAPRLFVAPAGRPLALWLDPLRARGFMVTLVFESPQYTAYSLVPP